MEPESDSDQTVWGLAETIVQDLWAPAPYTGGISIAVTIVFWRQYLERFGRFPPIAVAKLLSEKSVEINKQYLHIRHSALLPDQNMFVKYKGANSRQWAQSRKVSDFDN